MTEIKCILCGFEPEIPEHIANHMQEIHPKEFKEFWDKVRERLKELEQKNQSLSTTTKKVVSE